MDRWQDRLVARDAMYDRFAGEYAEHAGEGSYNALYDRPAVLELAGPLTGRTVLDAGCGPGFHAAEMLRRGARVVGFDQSPVLVDLARRRLARGRLGGAADLRVHDLADPLDWVPDASIDLVVPALVPHYVDDRLGALREFRRVLRPAGALVVSTTHPVADWQRSGGSYFAVEPMEGSLHPRRDWPVRTWRRPLTRVCGEFAEAGFLIERLLEPRPVPEMAARDPDSYARLEHAPAFIAFRLRPTPDTLR